MRFVSFCTSFLNWLKQTGGFYLDKKIAGEWQLYEYYTECDNQLSHFTNTQIMKNGSMMLLEFTEKGKFRVCSNLKLSILNEREELEWERQRNFISIFRANYPENKTKFQFAFQKDKLKLLNKNIAGEIQFFGFFKNAAIPDKK